MRLVLKLGVLFALAVAFGTAAAAQKKNPYRNYTEEKFVENMQSAGRNYAAVTNLVDGADYESAKAQLTRAREQLAITITFWRDQQKDDAVRMLRDALNGMDGLDAALSAASVDPATVKAASGRVNAACSACHAVYREQDPATKAYRLKLRN
jgi:cytochrome c556